jgi:hypothetical protein
MAVAVLKTQVKREALTLCYHSKPTHSNQMQLSKLRLGRHGYHACARQTSSNSSVEHWTHKSWGLESRGARERVSW